MIPGYIKFLFFWQKGLRPQVLSRSRSEAAGMTTLLPVRRLRLRGRLVIVIPTAEDGIKILGAAAAAFFMAARRIRWLAGIASGRLRSLEHKFARTASEDRTVASPTQNVQKKEIS